MSNATSALYLFLPTISRDKAPAQQQVFAELQGPVLVSCWQCACCCGKWGDAQGTEIWHPQNTAATSPIASSKPSSASFACLLLCPGRCSPAFIFVFGRFNTASTAREWWSTMDLEQHNLGWPHRLSMASLQTSASAEAQGQHPHTFPPFQGYIYSSRNHFLMLPNIRSYRAGMRKSILEVWAEIHKVGGDLAKFLALVQSSVFSL